MTDKYSVFGKSLPLIDSFEKVTGGLKFAGDLLGLPGTLYAKVLRSPHAHARIVKIDATKAEALPGVHAVITYKNTPDKDWTCLAQNWYGHVFDKVVRYVGDEVAAVAAIDEDTAEKALELIEVEYEELPAVFGVEEAIKPDAPQVRPDGNVRRPNICEWGDIDKGFKEADFIVEHTTRLGNQQHCPLDRNTCIASWIGDQLTIWTSSQMIFALRNTIANYLDMPLHKVRVISTPTGGSFGLWWQNNFHFIPILLSQKTGKLVKLELTREEVMSTVKRRETPVSHVKFGVKSDGKIIAASYKHYLDNGAYGNKSDPYQVSADVYVAPHGRYEAIGVSTNTLTAGCMRGVGDLTLVFCIEQAMDMVAEKLGMDPVEVRLKNHFRTGDKLNTSLEALGASIRFPDRPAREVRLTSCGMDECLRKGAEAIGWKGRWRGWGKPVEASGTKRQGIGVAIASHLCGGASLGSNGAFVRVNTDGTAFLIVGVGRMGQGADTTQAQIAAEALGIRLEDIFVIGGDTDVCPECTPTVASATTRCVSPTTREAAEDAKRQILGHASEKFGVKPEELDIKDRRIFVKQEPEKGIGLAEFLSTPVYDLQAIPTIVGRGAYVFPWDKSVKMMMAGFAEVEVDIETGQVRVLKYVATHDSGAIVNPVICENQVHGGVFMGAGFGLSENLVFDEKTGEILNPNYADYKVLGALDLPDPEAIFIDVVDPYGPFGAKGLGEGVACPVPAAIANAVYNAIGIRIDAPITPVKIIKALKEKGN